MPRRSQQTLTYFDGSAYVEILRSSEWSTVHRVMQSLRYYMCTLNPTNHQEYILYVRLS